MSIKTTIQKVFARKRDVKKEAGIIYKTPSESSKGTGFVSTTTPSVPETYKGEEVKIPTLSGGGSRVTGGGSSKISQEIISQAVSEANKGEETQKAITPTTQKIKLTSQQLSDLQSINKKPSETYDPRLRAYVSTTQRSGTSQIRPPTYEEREKLDIVPTRTGQQIFGKRKSENILTADVEVVSKNIEQVNTLSNDLTIINEELTKLEKTNNQGEWVGTDSELIDYNKKIDEYNSKLGRYNQLKNINVGVLGYETQRDIREFDLKRKPITSTFKIISSTAGSTAGGLAGDITEKEKLGKGVGKVVEIGYDVGKYAIPVLGTSIFVLETGENVIESGGLIKYAKEKPVEAGMTLAFGSLLIGKEVYQAGRNIKVPSKTTSTTEQIFFKKYTTENIPKLQKIETAQGYDLFPKLVKGGETTVIQEFNPITKIVTKGKRFKDIQRINVLGDIKGETTKSSILGKLGNEYKLKYEYISDIDLLKQELYKNKKLIKSEYIWNPEQKKAIGLTEMSKGNIIELKAKQVRPDKVRDIFSEKRTKYTQEYVSLEEGLKVKGKQNIRVFDVRQTTLEPATRTIKVGVKSGEGEVGIIKEVERKTARLSKSKSFDLLKLNEPVVYEGMVGSSGQVIKSPRFSDILTREIKSKGKFEITRETPITKFVEFESRLLRSKKGQTGLLELDKLDTRINVPTPRANLPEVTKFNMIFPEVRYGKSNLGVLTFKEERLLKYQPNVKTEDLGFSKLDSKILNSKLDVNIQNVDIKNIDLTKDLTRKETLNKSFTRTRTRDTLDVITPKPEEMFKEKQMVKEKVMSKEVNKLKDFLEQQEKEKYKFKEFYRSKERFYPKLEQIKVKIPLKEQGTTFDFTPKKEKLDEDFKVWITKGGKDIELKEEFTFLPKARERLKKELVGTLRAGGGIIKGGKKLTFKEIGLYGEEFMPSKISSFKVVQKRERRLSALPEIKEIQYFKSKRGKFL